MMKMKNKYTFKIQPTLLFKNDLSEMATDKKDTCTIKVFFLKL